MVIKENIQVALKLIDGSDLSSCVARERLEESLTLLEESIQVGQSIPRMKLSREVRLVLSKMVVAKRSVFRSQSGFAKPKRTNGSKVH